MAGKSVLVVDDDIKTVELVKLYLNRDGYKVFVAHDGGEALRLARESHPDLIVLDLMLPGTDGLQVCRTLRHESDVPIIMLTAKTTEQDRLTGLDAGADDYITKPFSPRELAARVRAVLRRLPDETGQRRRQAASQRVDPCQRPKALSPLPDFNPGVVCGGVDSLVGQVTLVVKIIKLGWRLQLARNGEDITIIVGGVSGYQDQGRSFNRLPACIQPDFGG